MTFSFDSFRLTGVLAILMAINAIPLYYLTRKNMVRVNEGLIMLFVSVYIIHIIGLVRMDNFVSGTFELEKKLSMLTFPLVLFFTPRLESKKVNSVLLMFAC